MSRQWKLLVLRGVLAIGLAVVAFTRPGITLLVLATLWGIYALADGIVALITAFKVRDEGRPVWPLILIGLLGIPLEASLWRARSNRAGNPDLDCCLGHWCWRPPGGARLPAGREISRSGCWRLSGVLSVIFGVVTIGNPQWGATVVIYTIGVYAFFLPAADRLGTSAPRIEQAGSGAIRLEPERREAGKGEGKSGNVASLPSRFSPRAPSASLLLFQPLQSILYQLHSPVLGPPLRGLVRGNWLVRPESLRAQLCRRESVLLQEFLHGHGPFL